MMIGRSAGLLAIVGIIGAAQAFADPTPLAVREKVDIQAPSDKVWTIIGKFDDMSWQPAVKATTATKGNTVGSVRTLDLGGPNLVEELTAYAPARKFYRYRITDNPNNVKTLPVRRYASTVAVTDGPNGTSIVTWRGTFLRADPSASPAAGQDDKSAIAAVTTVYRTGLDNLKTLVETR
jgi:hypothetical protein